MFDLLQPGTFWWYKNVQYRVIKLHEDKLSQDPQGSWVPTVEYECESVTDRTFFRAATEFMHKFGPKV